MVERTLAWLNRCRRLAKDWENLNLKARAFLLLALNQTHGQKALQDLEMFPDRDSKVAEGRRRALRQPTIPSRRSAAIVSRTASVQPKNQRSNGLWIAPSLTSLEPS